VTTLDDRAAAIADQLRDARIAAAQIADARDRNSPEPPQRHTRPARQPQMDSEDHLMSGQNPDSANDARPLQGSWHEALDALVAELSTLGWTAKIRTLPGHRPGVRASNPEPGATALSEDIYVRPGQGGGWEFCWPWAQPIASDPAAAAAVIVRVLRPAGVP
jgi:hypothetical protein